MKILYFLDFPYGVGGASIVLLKQAYVSKQRGHEVNVVIPNDDEGQHAVEFDKICQDFGLNIITAFYTVSTCMESIDIFSCLEQYREMVEIIHKHGAMLLHSTQLNLAVEFAARELAIPHLMNIYQTDKEAFHIKWMEVYPQYHCADSNFIVERWKEGLRISSRCIRVSYEKNEEEQEIREFENKAKLHIISIGTVCNRKNQLEIIKFVSKCIENGFTICLTILGNCDSEYGEQCKNFVKENGLDGHVIFTGLVLNVEDYFRKADLFILSSLVESYPGVIVESMANRVPVISTAVAGVPEILKDEENGFLIAGYKAEDIYQTFLRYMQKLQQGQIPEIIKKAYETYLRYHTYAVSREVLEDYYEWIIYDYHNRENTCCLKAEEVRKKFDVFIRAKGINNMDRTFMKYFWYMYHFTKIYENRSDKKLAIWGAGFWGKIVLDWICLLGMQETFCGFIDQNKQGKYLGYPIMCREVAIAKCGMIIVSIADENTRLEIMNYLETYGKVRNKDYFMIHNDPIRI